MQVLGSGTIMVASPVALSYAVHAFHSRNDRGWALFAMLGGALMVLPVLWILPTLLVEFLARVPPR